MKSKIGRPRLEARERYPLRHTPSQRLAWQIAAATTGLTLSEWAISVLDCEAAYPHHVAILKRAKAGR